MDRPITKDMLLRQVDGLRDIARRSRHLAGTMTSEADRNRLLRHSQELDGRASNLEKQAVDAKTGQIV
jgi:hypothetical protein